MKKKKNKKVVYANKYFKIVLKNDYYEIVPKNRDVLVVPVVDKKNFLLVKVRREFMQKNIYDFPAGGFDNLRESPLLAAKRELEEETGVILNKKNKFFKIANFYQMPNRIKKMVFIYGVHLSSEQINLNFNSNEIYSLEIKSYDQILNLIKKGRLNTAVPIAALFRYALKDDKLIKFIKNIKNI